MTPDATVREIFYRLLVIFGLAWVIADSKISYPLREWVGARSSFLLDLLECPACLSFWLGAASALLSGWGFVRSITFGFAATGCSLVLFLLVKFLNAIVTRDR